MRTWLTLSAVAVFAAACGGGDDDSDTARGKEYVDAIVASNEVDEPRFEEDEARCAAERWVDLVGVRQFEEAGVEPEDIVSAGERNVDVAALLDLTDEQADGFVDATVDCVDLGAVLTDTLAEQEALAGIPEAKLQCIGAEIEQSEAFHQALKQELLGDAAADLDFTTMATDAFDACDVKPSELVSN
jgi:hypothetical protein